MLPLKPITLLNKWTLRHFFGGKGYEEDYSINPLINVVGSVVHFPHFNGNMFNNMFLRHRSSCISVE